MSFNQCSSSWWDESTETSPARRTRRAGHVRELISSALALCLCLIFSAMGSSVSAQGQRPSPRHGHALAYSPARASMILFGGAYGDQILSDTWELRQTVDGLKWKRLRATGPGLRPGLAMAENPAGGTPLLVGTNALTGAFETWEFDVATKEWTRANPGLLNPPARPSYAMALDESRGVVVLFGGGDTASGVSADTWEWDAARKIWLGPFAGLLPARTGHAMAFYSRGLAGGGFGRTLLFGGEDAANAKLPDGWFWDGIDWLTSIPLNAPTARSGHAMAPLFGSVYLFGGHDGAQALSDTWRWDGTVATSWLRLTPAARPPARSRHAMATDGVRETIFLFGGLDANGNDLGDTWEFSGCCWSLVAP